MFNSFMQNIHKLKSGSPLWMISFFFIIQFTVLCNNNLLAQGNLLVAPHLVVFEGQKRVMEVNLANTGQDSAKYNVSFIQYRMTEEGGYDDITTPDPGQNFADQNIRIFPRSVMLGPNESQVIKLQLIKTDELKPGEYRSHLYLRAIPNQKALGEEVVKKDTAAISIRIIPVFGISIPVLVRVGDPTTTVNITDLKMEKASDTTQMLNFTINRSGNMSSYGDISVSHIAPNGKETKIGLSTGISVFTPTLLRRVKVVLENKTLVGLSKGKIHVLYSSESDTRPVKLAEADLLL
jgi:hypothetical protein